MTSILKYALSFTLVVALLIGCQDDSPDNTAQQTQQQPGQLQQMQQSAPDVELSDKEAAVFAKAAMAAQKVQMESQKKMIGIIQDEGLDVKTYQQIAKATQMGQSQDTVSDSNMEKYNNATDSIMVVQKKIQERVKQIIEDTGMEMQRFRKISLAARQDTQLQKQIQQQIREQMSGSGMQQQQ